MREKITTGLELFGMVLTVVGVGFFNVPISIVLAGVWAIVVGLLI